MIRFTNSLMVSRDRKTKMSNPDVEHGEAARMPDGSVYLIAENSYTGAELAGVCFNQKNNTMYLNIQQNGQTIAIKGDWNRVRS